MAIKRIGPFLGAGMAASVICATPASGQVSCGSAVDVSYRSQTHDPCGFDHWLFMAQVYTEPHHGRPIDAWLGPGGYHNACTGSYTDCSGQYHQNGEFWHGEKWMYSQIFPLTEITIWWTTTNQDLYMEGCVTPENEQGWTPQLRTWSWVNGFVRVYCN
jgi:hypothetical protein